MRFLNPKTDFAFKTIFGSDAGWVSPVPTVRTLHVEGSHRTTVD
jgi:hypothetical protein